MIEVQEMNIRVPGYSEEHGRQLGLDIAERVSSAVAIQSTHRSIDEIKVSVNSYSDISKSHLAEQIAHQILMQLNNR